MLKSGLFPATSFPQTIELDVAFPLNQTYGAVNPFSVIFVIQNADTAFNFGFNFHWEINGFADQNAAHRDSTPEDLDQGFMFVDNFGSPVVPSSNPYIIVNSTKYAQNGKWSLSWTYTLFETCSQSGSTFTSNGDVVGAQGSINFTIADGGAAPDLTANYPLLGG